jgi:hypothetical protein
LTGLVKKIDEQLKAAGKHPRALGAYIIFQNNSEGLNVRLRSIAEKESLKRVSLCIGPVPDQYEIAKDADATIVIYNPGRRGEQHVTANFALRKGELTPSKIEMIVKAFAAVLPKPPPPTWFFLSDVRARQ